MNPLIAAYVYPGWHACPVRDRTFPNGWSEWDLVYAAEPLFEGHRQPRLPFMGRYDDALPATAQTQVELARQHGVDSFIYGFFWNRGQRCLNRALDEGFLGAGGGGDFPFALMWANRMPRGVLPIKRPADSGIDPARQVHTDVEDFVELVEFMAEHYFHQDHYLKVEGRPLFSIFDSTFFLRQLGDRAEEAVARARERLTKKGLPGMYLLAVNPVPAFYQAYKQAGFDGVTHYVWLPEWKGDDIQEYGRLTKQRAAEWQGFAQEAGLPYYPSVSPGWDASPRGVLHGKPRPHCYPWSPVVKGETPDQFKDFVRSAVQYSRQENKSPLVFVASWNEWSEGHTIEPDTEHGTAWLEAIRLGRVNSV